LKIPSSKLMKPDVPHRDENLRDIFG